MGEIKSTLDIVMEKTKHLSMTDEEKHAKVKEDIRLAVKGLVQKYQDQLVSKEMFQKELGGLHQHYTFEDKDVLLKEIFIRIDLEADNTSLLELIKDVFQIHPVKFDEILQQYRDEIKNLAATRAEEMKCELNEKYSISGSAVVPNISADPSWQADVNNIKNRLLLKLDEVKSELFHQ